MKILNNLTESSLFPSRLSFRKFTALHITEIAYLHILAYRVLSCEEEARGEIFHYTKKTKMWNGFDHWHISGNDLFYVVHVLTNHHDDDLQLSSVTIKNLSKIDFDEHRFLDILRAVASDNGVADTYFRRFLLRLDNDLNITNSSLRSIRRLVMNWPDITKKEKQLAMTRLLQFMKARCPTSDLLPMLRKLAHDNDLELVTTSTEKSVTFKQMLKHHKLEEDDAATTSVDIAPVVKPLGKVRKRSR